MFFKISLKNVKRSTKNYIIYFMTLSFSICLFYAFNSIEAQNSMLVISSAQNASMKMISGVMKYVSSFITVILAFLIIYANYFLIKRRKKEFAIYFILGMEKRKISNIVIVETIIIGILSLFIGLGMGIFLSHFLSILTAKLFMVDLKEFHFIFSSTAFFRTIMYFSLIFMVVGFFNILSITRLKLIDLLNDGKKNEVLKLRNYKIAIKIFICSIVFIGIGYRLIIINGFREMNNTFIGAIVFGGLGTFLFFMSLFRIVIEIVQRNKKLYFRGLNSFVFRQMNNKINTNVLSITIICLMLLISIGTLATGIGMATVMDGNTKRTIPYDVSLFSYGSENSDEVKNPDEIYEELKDINPDLENLIKEYDVIRYYPTDIFYKDVLDFRLKSVTEEVFQDYKFTLISLSDFNNIMRNQGKKELQLKNDEFAITYNNLGIGEYYEDFLKSKPSMIINGNKLVSDEKKLYVENLFTDVMAFEIGSFIVNDQCASGLEAEKTVFNLNYSKNKEETELEFVELATEILRSGQTNFINFSTKIGVINNSLSIKTIVAYLSIYVGILFLIISTVILALQQLSESSDNIMRYELLKKLGADKRALSKALLLQIGIYFLLPLSLAIIHSIVGIKVAYGVVLQFGNINILFTSISVMLIFIVIYGGYYIATYLCSKNIIKMN